MLDESLSTAPFSQTIQTTHFDQVPQGGTLWQPTHPVFAVGDVRAGSAKRVAAAVGEGSVVMQYVHTYLARVGSKERMRKPV